MRSRLWSMGTGVLVTGCAMGLLSLAVWAQDTKETVTVDKADRTYLVHLPKGFDAQQHYPVVVLLHGPNQQAEDMERLTRFNDLADKDSIIVVYPNAMQGHWNVGVTAPQQRRVYRRGYGRRWGYPGYLPPPPPQQTPRQEEGQRRRQERADDVEFFNKMLDQLSTQSTVDMSRIYFAGLSDGGFMALRVGCNLSDRVAAIASVGAAMPKTMICVPSRPVPVVMVNGTSDPVVKYDGGTGKDGRFQTISAEDSAKEWAKLDRCGEKPVHSKLPEHGKGGMQTKVETFDGCQENAQVELYSVKGGGNTWPGGEQYEPENTVGKTSQDFNANEVVWSFLVTRRLPAQNTSQKQD